MSNAKVIKKRALMQVPLDFSLEMNYFVSAALVVSAAAAVVSTVAAVVSTVAAAESTLVVSASEVPLLPEQAAKANIAQAAIAK